MDYILHKNNIGVLTYINQSVIIISDKRILWHNECFNSLVGGDNHFFIGVNFFEYVEESDKNKVYNYLSSVKESNIYCAQDIVEFRFKNSDDEELIIELSGKKVEYEGQLAILCSLNDVTEKLKKSRQLRRILDAIPEAIIVFDNAHQQIISANNATESIYSIPASQFEDNIFHPIDLVVPEDLERVKKFYYNLIEIEYEKIEYRIVNAIGETKWVRDEGEVVYKEGGYGQIHQIYHFIRDITQRKQSVEKLRISERKYRRIFEYSTDPIFVAAVDGKFINLNTAALKFFGFAKKSEAMSASDVDYYWNSQDRETILKIIETEGSVIDFPVKFRTVAGDSIEVMIAAGRQRNYRHGQLRTYQAIIHDTRRIIERTELETYRRTLGGIADRLNNLVQIQLLHYGLIHDYLQVLESTEDDSQKIEWLDKIIESIGDSENIVLQLEELGATVRKLYHAPEPPKPVADGTGGILFDLKF